METGHPVPRLAFVVAKMDPQTFEAIVDAIGGKVLSWEEVKDV